jgi:hypothetical protein
VVARLAPGVEERAHFFILALLKVVHRSLRLSRHEIRVHVFDVNDDVTTTNQKVFL